MRDRVRFDLGNGSRACYTPAPPERSGNASVSRLSPRGHGIPTASTIETMQNFLRALRLACRYQLLLAGAFGCSLAIAFFWGANIGTMYPVLEVTLKGRSLQRWAEDEIVQSEQRAKSLTRQLGVSTSIEAASAEAGRSATAAEREVLEYQLRAESFWRDTIRWLQPWLIRYLPNDPFRTVVVISLVLFVATLLKCALLYADSMLVSRLVQLLAFDLRKQFFDHALRLDMRSLGTERVSGLMSRFNVDLGFLSNGTSALFGSGIREPLKMVACFAGASFFCWRLLLFSLILTPLAAWPIHRLTGSIKRANRRAMEQSSRLFGVLSETFNGMQAVQAYGMESYERLRFYRVAREALQKAMRIVFYSSLTKPVNEMLGFSVIGLAFVAGAYLVLNQETHLLGVRMCSRPMSLSSLLVFYAFLIGAVDPARKLSGLYSTILGGAAAADRIYSLLDQPSRISDPPMARPVAGPIQRLVFDHVSFRYADDQPVLRDIQLEIQRGDTVAIVGGNGCGKTTLVNFIPRFLDPLEGAVRLDGVDLRELSLRQLRGRIAMVTQHTMLFDDTVMNNIRYGSPNASDEEVAEAARQANAHHFIEQDLESGYQTIVGPAGNRLSGGQRQRISLARAMLRDPEILILDEATSQIDLKSEQLIHEALATFLQSRTAVIITHRLSTLTLANRIVVMDAGQIVDSGTHHQLMARCPLYQRLHQIELRECA